MKQIINFFSVILSFGFDIPYDLNTGECLHVSIFGILIVFICVSIATYIINRLTK